MKYICSNCSTPNSKKTSNDAKDDSATSSNHDNTDVVQSTTRPVQITQKKNDVSQYPTSTSGN